MWAPGNITDPPGATAHAPGSPERSPLRVLDLFAGAGGLSTGMQLNDGFHVVAAVEMDIAAAATYQANHTEAAVHVGTIQQWLADTDTCDADVIVGGPPCQGFSTLNRSEDEDARNELWREYATTILRVEPQYFVVENVAAFLKSPQYAMFEDSTRPGADLADYRFEGRVLNAADHGAHQARRRAVLIGHHRDLPFPGWPEPTHAGAHRTVRQALASIPTEVGGRDLPDRVTEFAGRQLPGTFRTFELHVGRTYTDLSMRRFRAIPPGGSRFDLPQDLKARCWKDHTTGSGDVMGRLYWDKPSVTIRTEFFKPEKGRYLHPTEHRVITHREAAALQGFPDDHLWVGSKVQIARQIGNAVPLPLGQVIGARLIAARS